MFSLSGSQNNLVYTYWLCILHFHPESERERDPNETPKPEEYVLKPTSNLNKHKAGKHSINHAHTRNLLKKNIHRTSQAMEHHSAPKRLMHPKGKRVKKL